MPEAILLMRFRSKRQSELSVGTEYRSREAPHISWQIIAQYEGADGLLYAVLEISLTEPGKRRCLEMN
jgi:hypothetical protein